MAAVNLEVTELLNMVNELPVGYRTVFNLYAIEGYSHREIADRLEISENTSKSQLSRARALLQKQVMRREVLVEQYMKRHGEA
jgi:RNA polymerase sigma factor (sigma-70 family)